MWSKSRLISAPLTPKSITEMSQSSREDKKREAESVIKEQKVCFRAAQLIQGAIDGGETCRSGQALCEPTLWLSAFFLSCLYFAHFGGGKIC